MGHSLMRARAGLDDLAGAHVDDAASTISPDRTGVSREVEETHWIAFAFPPAHARAPSSARASVRQDRLDGRAANFSSWLPCSSYANAFTAPVRSPVSTSGRVGWKARSKICAPTGTSGISLGWGRAVDKEEEERQR